MRINHDFTVCFYIYTGSAYHCARIRPFYNGEENGSAGGAIFFRIRPPVVQKEKEKYENELGWTLEKPKDGDYRGILLSSDPPSISEIAERFTNSDFIIEDFELGSPHSWRRMF